MKICSVARLKAGIALFLLVVQLFLLCACGGQAVVPAPQQPQATNALPAPSALPGDVPPYRMLCTLPSMDSQNMTLLARGVQDRCDKLGIQLQMHNSHGDHMSQALEVDTFVAGGGQAVLCRPVEAAALQPFLALARQQGVYVVAYGEGVECDTYLVVDDRAGGALLGKNAAEWASAQTQQNVWSTPVLLLSGEGAPGNFGAGVTEAYTAVLPETVPATYTVQAPADGLVEEILAENPYVNIFLADSDAAALLAMAQLEKYWVEERARPLEELDWDRYYFGGFGATQPGLAALAGTALRATVSENGYEAGKKMVDMVLELKDLGTAAPQTIGPVLVDKANAAEYN